MELRHHQHHQQAREKQATLYHLMLNPLPSVAISTTGAAPNNSNSTTSTQGKSKTKKKRVREPKDSRNSRESPAPREPSRESLTPRELGDSTPKDLRDTQTNRKQKKKSDKPKRTLRLKRTTQSQNRDSNNNQVKRTSLNPSRDLNHSHSLPWIFPRQPIRVLRYKMAMKERPQEEANPNQKTCC